MCGNYTSVHCISFFASDYVGRASEGLKLLSGGVFVVYIFFFYQMLLATFWGLFYLGDKIHQVD